MREQIHEAGVSAQSLGEAKEALLDVFRKVRQEKGDKTRIGYVAGIVNSDGAEFRERNIRRLVLFTDKIGEQFNMPTFSAADVFPEQVFINITKDGFDPEKFIGFWRDIFGSGFITDVYMTPRWEESYGARDEEKMAKTAGLRIHYVEESLLSTP